MNQYKMKLNEERCISCQACEVHCKIKNRVPLGAKLCTLSTSGPIQKDGRPKFKTKFMSCFQCKEPKCVEACPTGALIKREKDGIVFVDKDLCIGCKTCMEACPWSVPQWDEATGKIIKCDFCRDRLDQGLQPACVTGCTAHALSLVPVEKKPKVQQ